MYLTQVCIMRTTINLDDDLFELVRSMAHQNRKGIGATVQALIRRGLRSPADNPDSGCKEVDELTGFPVFSSKKPISIEDVRSLEDGG